MLETSHLPSESTVPVYDQQIMGAVSAALATSRPALIDMAIGYAKAEQTTITLETLVMVLQSMKSLLEETYESTQKLEQAKREVDTAYRATRGTFRRLGVIVGQDLGLADEEG